MCDLLIRLSKELQAYKQGQETEGGNMILDFGPDLQSEAADPLVWFARVKGPPNTPYEGGTFLLRI